MSDTTEKISYFVVKCRSLESLKTCIKSEIWAFKERDNPPQPKDLLASAHKSGRVILIFSVNNQHGWHGFCESLYLSKICTLSSEKTEVVASERSEELVTDSCSGKREVLFPEEDDAEDSLKGTSNSNAMPWHRFPVKWLKNFHLFGNQTCLSFKQTQHLTTCDGNPLNKARNWERLTQSVGDELCDMIEKHLENLILERSTEEEKIALRNKSFFEDEISMVSEAKEDWGPVIKKVERDLGQLHLVCPFGSQRYNCSLPESDNDIFMVYQARTTQMLALDPPKQTIKNHDKEAVDYTVLELQRYCELLVAGDSKCIETLFLLDTEVLTVATPEWKQLCDIRQCLLTESCFYKYMHEAEGSRGLKQILKWRNNNPESEELPPKLKKLGYIVLRLLQNARELIMTNALKVYREFNSPQRQELLDVRQGSYTFSDLMDLVNRYITEINDHKAALHNDGKDAKARIQNWLLDRRIQDLQCYPHEKTFL